MEYVSACMEDGLSPSEGHSSSIIFRETSLPCALMQKDRTAQVLRNKNQRSFCSGYMYLARMNAIHRIKLKMLTTETVLQ